MWLVKKYNSSFKLHHANKTLGQFFPPLYEEYFAVWPPTPTTQGMDAVGNPAIATTMVRKTEEIVSDFGLATRSPF